MALNQIQTFAEMVNLQVAAEAFWQKLQSGISPLDVLVQGNENNSREPAVVADLFNLAAATSRYKVIAHQDLTLNDGKTVAGVNDKSGFSATLFLDTLTGQYTLSIRSTEFASSIRDGGDVKADIAIGVDGWSFAQISSLEKFWTSLLQLNAVNGQNASIIPSYTDLGVFASQMSNGAKVNVTGYSLGANVAEAFVEIHRTQVDHVYFFNGAGTGMPNSGQTLSSVFAKYQSVFADPASYYANFNFGNGPASIAAAYQKYQANPNANYQSVYDNPRHVLAEWAIYGLTQGAALRSLTGFISGAPRTADGQMLDLYAYNYSGNDVIDTAAARSGQRHGTGLPIWYEDQPATTWTNGDFSQYDWGQGHSIVLLQDSLNLMAAFEKLDPTITEDKLATIFQASSNKNYDSLEKTLDALGRVFGVATPVAAATADNQFADISLRNALYQRINEIQTNSAFLSLVGKVTIQPINANLATQAKARVGFEEMSALLTLSPFVISGNGADGRAALQALWQSNTWNTQFQAWLADKASLQAGGEPENFTDQYLTDRALLLQTIVKRNTEDISGTTIGSSTVPTDRVVDLQFIQPGTSVKTTLTVWNPANNGTQNALSTRPHQLIAFDDDASHSLIGTEETKFGDRLYGGGGNDTIRAFDGDDYLEGNAGNDVLGGDKGVDTLVGGAGDDTLSGGEGHDLLLGGAGNDTYYFEGNIGLDIIRDSDGVGMVVMGSASATPLSGGKKLGTGSYISNDRKTTFTLIGADLIIQTADAAATGAIIVKDWQAGQLGIVLDEAPASALPGGTPILGDFTKKTNDAGTQYLLANGNYVDAGTPEQDAPDLITGTSGGDIIRSLGGADAVLGLDGDDLLEGGEGADILQGGRGSDTLRGGGGVDYLLGSSTGSLPYPTTAPWTQPNSEYPFPVGVGFGWSMGFASVDSDGYPILLVDSAVSRSRLPDDGRNVIEAGPGGDFVLAGVNADLVHGDADNDQIIGLAGDDVLFGDGGNDIIYGDGTAQPNFLGSAAVHGRDVIDGGQGNDILIGQGNDDVIYGGSGNDVLYGDDRNTTDTPLEMRGNDYLDGGEGDDFVVGNEGSDILVGGVGNDTLVGGAGKDIYIINRGGGVTLIYDDKADGNIVRFGAGINRDNVKLYLGSLLIDLGGGDQVHIEGFDATDAEGSLVIDSFPRVDATRYLRHSQQRRAVRRSGHRPHSQRGDLQFTLQQADPSDSSRSHESMRKR